MNKLIFASCALLLSFGIYFFNEERPNERKITSSINIQKRCFESLSNYVSSAMATQFENELPSFKSTLHNVFKGIDDYGFWKFRSKNEKSILAKLNNKVGQIRNLKTYEKIESAISDGLGARFVLSSTGQTSMFSVFNALERAIRNNELEVLEIKNYGLKNGFAYLDESKVQSLMNAAGDSGQDIHIKTGKEAIKEKGYVSLHLKIRAPSGKVSEIQFRGELIDQLSEVDHLFYDMIQGKPLAKELRDNPELEKISLTMSQLNEYEKEQYTIYLQKYFEFLRKIELDMKTQKAPVFPTALKRLNILKVKNIWNELQPYYQNKNYKKNLFDY